MPPHRRGAPLLCLAAALALFATASLSLVLAETIPSSSGGASHQTPSAAASAAAAGSGSGSGSGGDSALGGRLLGSSFAPPWASAAASVSSVTARAACSLFSREASAAARDSRLGLAAAAACEVATNLELWLEPLLSGSGSGGGGNKPFLPAGAKKHAPLLSSSSSSPSSDALAADRAAVASTAAAAASTTSGGSSSAASASATANARPVCSAATLFPGKGGSSSSSSSPSSNLLLPVCSAPSFELVADGGRCAVESRPPHAVVCVGPSVVLEVTPPRCFLSSSSSSTDENEDDAFSSSSSSPSRSLVVDAHCGPPASIATGGQRVFLGGKRLPVFSLNGSSVGGEGGSGASSLAEYDRAAAALSSWPSGFGGAPLADAKSLAELLAVSLLPGRVTATASVVEE